MKKDIRVGITMYDTSCHQKSIDVLLGLLRLGIEPIIIPQPFIKRGELHPVYPHRKAFNDSSIHPIGLAKRLGLQFGEPRDCDVIALAGANIVGEEYWGKSINAHPGILPYTRGLDSLKWAILNENPIGITCHVIGEEVDSGRVLLQALLEPDWNEEFYHFAMRMYDAEIDLLCDATLIMANSGEFPNEKIVEPKGEVHKRMGARDEMRMMAKYKMRAKP